MGIAAVAIATGDTAILVVDAQLGALAPADRAAIVDGLTLGFVVAAGAVGAATLHVPTPAGVRDDMVGFRSFAHVFGVLSRFIPKV